MSDQRQRTGYEDLIVITSRELVKGDFLEQLQKVLRLSPRALILREKDLDDETYERLAERVMAFCSEARVSCFLHSRLEVAERLSCSNIHLPFSLFMESKEMTERFSCVSVSCHSLSEAEAAEKAGAGQIVLGTIFETSCKPGRKGKGPGFVKEVCASVSIPVYAIGGVTPETLPVLKEAGAAGGCMMSGFMQL